MITKFRARYIQDSTINRLIFIHLLLAAVAFFKDILLAVYFGTSEIADALMLAYFIPDTIGNNLMAAAIAVAYVPFFSTLLARERNDQLYQAIQQVIFIFLSISTAIIVLLILFGRSLLQLIGTGMDENLIQLCYQFFLIILPIILLYPLTMIATSILHTYHKFNLPALTQVLHNGVLFIFLLSLIMGKVPVRSGGYWMASAITLATLVMTMIHWYAIFKGKINFSLLYHTKTSYKFKQLSPILHEFWPYFLILISTQIVYFVDRYLASSLGTGTIAGLNYAFRVSQFPIWVFVAAVNAVILPSLSRASAMGDYQVLLTKFKQAMMIILSITIPVALIFFVFRVPLISLLFQRGAFNETSLSITSDILAGYSLAIVGQSATLVCIRYFLAVKKMIYPFMIMLLAALITIISDFLLVDWMGAGGIGYASFIGSIVSAGLLLYYLFKDVNQSKN